MPLEAHTQTHRNTHTHRHTHTHTHRHTHILTREPKQFQETRRVRRLCTPGLTKNEYTQTQHTIVKKESGAGQSGISWFELSKKSCKESYSTKRNCSNEMNNDMS